jgi:hypothetical protein
MNRALAFVSVLVITSFALAQEVQFLEVGPFDALDKTLHYVQEFDNAKPDSGTVNPHAIVCTVKMSADLTVSAAIDADGTDAAKPNILRLDFTGKGKFDDKMVLKPVKSDGVTINFGPTTLQVKIGERTIPVAVQANYVRTESYRSLALIVGTGVQANCKIGDKEYMVRMLDGHDPNFKYNDKLTVGKRAGDNTGGEADAATSAGVTQCDTVAVYVPDKTALNGRKSITKGYYGQPVAVEGKWYDITLGADGKKIEVAAFTGQLGKVKLGGDWTCRLTGRKYALAAAGNSKLADMPVDEYTVDNAAAFSAAGADGKKTKITLYPSNKPRKLTVSADKEAELTFGAPLLAKTQAQAAGGNVMLSMSLADSSGMRVVSIAQANEKMPDPPTVQIVDADGKMVYKTSLSYG